MDTPTTFTQVLVFLWLGLWIGFAAGFNFGLGWAHDDMLLIALEKPRIDGNVTIQDNGKPITISGFYMEVKGCDPAILVKEGSE